MGGAINTNSTVGSSNFDGSGQAVVKTNTTAGFSIVSYTGNSSGGGDEQTIGHGLGVTPQVIIMKARSWSSESSHWAMYHHKVTDANTDYMKLNQDAARLQTDTDYMNQTLPTSTVFSLGYNFTTNKNSETYIAYCFNEVSSYSKFGTYQGNGNADGTFVFTGFRPAWLMVKNTVDSGSYWLILSNKRRTFNPNGPSSSLYANEASAENTFGNGTGIDFLSNGFKLRDSQNNVNASGDKYIYLAFAESPFKNSRAR